MSGRFLPLKNATFNDADDCPNGTSFESRTSLIENLRFDEAIVILESDTPNVFLRELKDIGPDIGIGVSVGINVAIFSF